VEIKNGVLTSIDKTDIDSNGEFIIPLSVVSIGVSTFEKCNSLKSLIFPSTLTDIQTAAFAECDSLVEITFPSNVTTIESFAFEDCSNLEKVVFKGELKYLGVDVFSYCDNLKEIHVCSKYSKKIFEETDNVPENCKLVVNPWMELGVEEMLKHLHIVPNKDIKNPSSFTLEDEYPTL
jgi:hypothetical protein